MTQIWVNIGSGNGLSGGTKPLLGLMLTCHQGCSVAYTWEKFHNKCAWTYHVFRDYTLRITTTSPRGQWVNNQGHRCHQCMFCAWWRDENETFSAFLALCMGNSPVTGEFPSQRPVTRGFDVFFDLHLNKRLSKQSWGWWFEMPSRSLWCHHNVVRKDPVTDPEWSC